MVEERTREARGERLEAGTLHVYALNEYVEMLREEPQYRTNGRNGITLVKTSALRVVLEVLQGGSELAEHRAPGPITLQVLEGSLRFHTGEDTYRIRQGELLALPAGRLHSVEAVRDSVFLLTITPAVPEEDTH